jgi:hypothetical protein
MPDAIAEANQTAHFAVLKKVSFKYSQEDVAQALHASKGMVFAAARILGCAPNTIYNYFKRYPELRDVQQAERGLLTDTAELKLADAIERGEAWAICFYLKTQAKDRGYVERQEVMSRERGPIEPADITKLRREKLTLAVQNGLNAGCSLRQTLQYLHLLGVPKDHLALVRGEDLVIPDATVIDDNNGHHDSAVEVPPNRDNGNVI